MQKALQWIKDNESAILSKGYELLRIPSVSPDPNHKEDMIKCANWIVSNFERLGMESRLLETPGNPVVFAQTKVDPNKPTILCYFHYDVQPAGEESLWKSPAFEPSVRDERVYARGSNDNKLTGIMPIVAIEAMVSTDTELPVNFKFCIEGDEERSSPHVVETIQQNKELFACDYFMHCDGTHLSEDIPAIELGCRGIIYTQIRLSIGEKDLHSGEFGGSVKNANFELAKLINQLKDENGKITIPGFYDGVLMPSEKELESWKEVPITEEERKETAAVYTLDEGEQGYSAIERNWSRPTLEINGMWGGYTEEGAKTIIPFESYAKISMRLVPGQEPEDIINKFKSYLKTFENPGVKIEIEWEEHAKPFLINADDSAFTKLEEAYVETFQNRAYYVRTGGTIGLLTGVQETLQVPMLCINGRSPDEDIHAPNEFLRLKNFWRGIEVCLRFFEKLGSK